VSSPRNAILGHAIGLICGYTLTDGGRETYFCNARCLCIWAVQHATHPRISEEQKLLSVEPTCPDGTRRGFATVLELA
jgi:hypothetical protein